MLSLGGNLTQTFSITSIFSTRDCTSFALLQLSPLVCVLILNPDYSWFQLDCLLLFGFFTWPYSKHSWPILYFQPSELYLHCLLSFGILWLLYCFSYFIFYSTTSYPSYSAPSMALWERPACWYEQLSLRLSMEWLLLSDSWSWPGGYSSWQGRGFGNEGIHSILF